MNTQQIEKLIEKELSKLREKILREITLYRRNKLKFKNCNKITQQILRTSGIYYKKTLPLDWED